ncbi:unnamed protein product [Cylicocyclus nassatus]|uniref:DDE Tnp4 domain-containing protein n=1 Tax=Cylicocyclus nassatus TaxID=53992 RepID=A0AA36H3A8_CYLNA|nr:unnamed protein product [Cylicocyclus nassatus]
MAFQQYSNLLERLHVLEEAVANLESTARERRQYVRQEQRGHLSIRFRLFDEYLVTRRPEGFLDFIRLMPGVRKPLSKDDSIERLRFHADPIVGRHRLMMYLRIVTQGISFTAFALDMGCGVSTVSEIVRDITESIITGVFGEPRRGILPTREFGTVGPVQYHILVNGGFGQSYRMIRPYREREANTADRRRFNRIFSRARRTIESTFGILAQRFRILMTRINMDPERTSRIVISLMVSPSGRAPRCLQAIVILPRFCTTCFLERRQFSGGAKARTCTGWLSFLPKTAGDSKKRGRFGHHSQEPDNPVLC